MDNDQTVEEAAEEIVEWLKYEGRDYELGLLEREGVDIS